MADDRNNQVVGYPTREIRVTGERCASMVHTTVAVSRFEIQLVNMSMSSAINMRDAVRKSSERFKNALDAFESELRECQRDLDVASKRKRPTNRRPGGAPSQQTAPAQNSQPVAKQQSTPAAQNKPDSQQAKPAKAGQNQQGKPAAEKKQQQPKNTDAKNGGNAKAQPKQAAKAEANIEAQKSAGAPTKANQAKTETPVPVLD